MKAARVCSVPLIVLAEYSTSISVFMKLLIKGFIKPRNLIFIEATIDLSKTHILEGKQLRYFLDTEFIEDGKTIDLISIGIVSEDGREFYAVNEDCDFGKASDWVLENVLKPMGLSRAGFNQNPEYLPLGVSSLYHESSSVASCKQAIGIDLMRFLAPNSISTEAKAATRSAEDDYRELEFWADYASYDWVAFCQLFGTMMDLPKEFPMYCNDIQQLKRSLDNPGLPKQDKGEHNALADAKWNLKIFNRLNSL